MISSKISKKILTETKCESFAGFFELIRMEIEEDDNSGEVVIQRIYASTLMRLKVGFTEFSNTHIFMIKG